MFYIPIPITREVIFDSQLSDADFRLIAMMQAIRYSVQYESDEQRKKQVLDSIRTSIFAEPRGKHRDTVRRELNSLQSNQAAQKYIKIFFVKDKLNTEHRIVIHFQDELPNSLTAVQSPKFIYTNRDEKISFEEKTLIAAYLKDSPLFSGDSPATLLELTNVKATELIKGLIYTHQMSKRLENEGRKIKNPKGYLINCFDERGLFKYSLVPKKYLSESTEVFKESPYEFEITHDTFVTLKNLLSNKRRKFQYRFRESGNTIYLKQMTMAGNPVNPVRWFKRFDLPFKIVEDYEGGE